MFTMLEQIKRSLQPTGGIAKRLFDIAFALFALISLFPLFLIIIVILKVVGRGQVFYVHPRVGYDGTIFGCIKFRTMVEDADARLAELLDSDPEARAEFERDSKLKNDPRIVPVIGNFMRSTSLDELPQFINVLLGTMSVVGPRPVTDRELMLYEDGQLDYVSGRPGVTGLWQISGRNETSFEERVAIDRRYVSTWSFAEDVRIIVRTIGVVVRREGAY